MTDAVTIKTETAADCACYCGASPLWHPLEKRLYWADVLTGRLYRYDPSADAHETVYEGRPVGGFTIQPDGALLLFRDRGNVVIWRDGKARQTVIEEIAGEGGSRFNDVIADPEGRVYAGTLPTSSRPGRLYRLDPDGSYHVMLDGVGCSSGMDFTLDETGLYHTDAAVRTISLFDYDRHSGELAGPRVVVQTDDAHGRPAGLAVDEYGDLWSAHHGGRGVYRRGSDGMLKQIVQMPCSEITSLTFAGDEWRDVYVTSAGGDRREAEGEPAGALFRFRAEVRGRATFFSRIGV